MKTLIIVLMSVVFALPAWAGGNPNEPTKEEMDEYSSLLRKYAKLKEDCDPKDIPAEKAKAAKNVRKKGKKTRNNPGLNKKERAEVTQIVTNALNNIQASDCCEELRNAVNDLDERLTDLENRVGELEKRANAGDAKDDEQDQRLDELEDSQVVIKSRMSHMQEEKNNTQIKLRAWTEIFGSAAHVYAAAQFGGSIVFQQHRQWKRSESEKEGYLLIGLSGSVGTALQSGPDMTYATGGFVAWQWPFGLYLGAMAQFLVEGMDPSQHWFVGGGLLLGATIPKPTKNPKASFFVEGFVGPAGRLSGEPGWPEGWAFVPFMGGRIGVQFL